MKSPMDGLSKGPLGGHSLGSMSQKNIITLPKQALIPAQTNSQSNSPNNDNSGSGPNQFGLGSTVVPVVTKGGFLERAGLVSSSNRNVPTMHSAALNIMKK